MKKILIISYCFPPNNITSSKRPAALVNYLPQYGWRPIVLTAHWSRDNCNYDPSVAQIYNNDFYKYEINIEEANSSISKKAMNTIIRFCCPQLHPYNFLKEGRKVVEAIIDEHQLDIIWATAPPINTLDIARYASKLTNKPWIADFRDVWQWIPNSFVKHTMASRVGYEKKLVEKAIAITSVSEGFSQTLAKRHGRLINTISHGYDDEAVGGEYPNKICRFNLVYTGSLKLGQPDFTIVLDAIANLIERRIIAKDEVSIEFYGDGNEKIIKKLFSNHNAFSRIINYGLKPRRMIIDAQRNAAILLLATHPGMNGWNTSKMFEYIVARRPIMAFPKDNDCIDRMIVDTRTGVSVNSVKEIEYILEKFYLEWKTTGNILIKPDHLIIKKYSYSNQIKLLSELLSVNSVNDKR
jgi:hypothetical protein